MPFSWSGQAVAFRCLLNQQQPENLVLRLYVNDIWPLSIHGASDYTEADGYGYEPRMLLGQNWTIFEGNPCRAAYARQTFTFTGPLGWVCGYYLTQEKSGRLVVAERFSAKQGGARNIQNNGDRLSVTVRLRGPEKRI